jgi:hypothetical protein
LAIFSILAAWFVDTRKMQVPCRLETAPVHEVPYRSSASEKKQLRRYSVPTQPLFVPIP